MLKKELEKAFDSMKEEVKQLINRCSLQKETIDRLSPLVEDLEDKLMHAKDESESLTGHINTQSVYTGKLDQIIVELRNDIDEMSDAILIAEKKDILQTHELDSIHSFFNTSPGCGSSLNPIMTRLALYLETH